MEQIYIHLGIGLFIIVGFFVYWGRIAGWYKKGGLIYEWWHNRKKQNNTELTKTKDNDQ